jgi:hypothetical protein
MPARNSDPVDRYPVLGDHCRVLLGNGEGSGQRLGMEFAGGIDALPEPYDPGTPVDLGQSAAAVGVGDQQPDGVGAAVDDRDRPVHAVSW